MAIITLNPFVSKDYKITIGTDNYEMAFTSAEIQADQPIVKVQTLVPAGTYSEPGSLSLQFAVAWLQDHVTANSLDDYLKANAGLQKTVTLRPRGTGTGLPTFTFEARLARGNVGGAVGAFATSSAVWGIIGDYTKTVQ